RLLVRRSSARAGTDRRVVPVARPSGRHAGVLATVRAHRRRAARAARGPGCRAEGRDIVCADRSSDGPSAPVGVGGPAYSTTTGRRGRHRTRLGRAESYPRADRNLDRAAGDLAVRLDPVGLVPGLGGPAAQRRRRTGPGRPTRAAPGPLRCPDGIAVAGLRGRTAAAPRPGHRMTGGDDGHPPLALNDTVHQRVRLAILTVLSESQECRFATLRDELGLTDGNLNRHLRVLEDSGLIQVTKGSEGRRPVTWLRLSRLGRNALKEE